MHPPEVIYLEVEDVLYAHARGLALYGGAAGLRDRSLLESAVMLARAGYYYSIAELAAVYAHGIAENHAFVDGNKRAALMAAAMFLGANGHDVELGPEWEGHMIGVASGTVSRNELITRFTELLGGNPVFLGAP